MNYLSTKQVSEIWGISPRRIVLLASQGRIEGAEQIDGRWFIPEEAKKPQDPRIIKKAERQKKEDSYVFPFLLGCIYSEEQISRFSEEEKKLLDLCLLYETGDFAGTREMAEKLLNASNPYVRLGALYHLPTICMYLGDYDATERYSVLFRTACHSCTEHKAEISVLLRSFESEMESVTEYAVEIDPVTLRLLPDDLLPTAAAWMLFSDISVMIKNGSANDPVRQEITCRLIENQGYFFEAMYMHLCISALYGVVNALDEERLHIRQAIDIGLEHGIMFTLAYSLSFNPTAAAEVLKDYPPEVVSRLKSLAQIFVAGRTGYSEYRGRTSVLTRLKDEDYALITLCLKNRSIEEMAKEFGLTRSGINKRLAALYRKLGVRSKNEMTRTYMHSLLDWGSDKS